MLLHLLVTDVWTTILKGVTSLFMYFEKKMAKLFKIVISNLFQSSPSLLLFALESILWCFSFLAKHYF